jgi:hypothetical protein
MRVATVYQPGDAVEYRGLFGATWVRAEFIHRCTEGPRADSLAVRLRRKGRQSVVIIGIEPDHVRPLRIQP